MQIDSPQSANWGFAWKTAAAASAAITFGQPLVAKGGGMSNSPQSPVYNPSEQTIWMGQFEKVADAKFEAAEARTETKFAQLFGKIELLAEKISNVSTDIGSLKTDIGTVNTNLAKVEAKTTNTRVIVVSTIIGAFLATAGIVYTVASYSVAIASFVKGN